MKLTTKDIIKEFRKVHGKKYIYSKVDYVNTDSKVIIICKEHGEFLQSPYYHKKGSGCPYCSGTVKRTKEEVIREFREKHGNIYDYSQVEYVNTDTNVIIGCKIHGDFLQRPDRHKRGAGCPKCSGRGFSKRRNHQIISGNSRR